MTAERTREHRRWAAMIQRCQDPHDPRYRFYGDRGIGVCDRWHDFENYYADVMRLLGPCPPRMSLNRIDNDGDYEPGNVRWATARQQRDNSRGPGGGCIDRYRQYMELRADGMDSTRASLVIGVDPPTTGARYERWLKSGVPFT